MESGQGHGAHPPRPPRPPPAMHGGAVAQSGSSQSAVPSPSL
eukprot:COSAG04_NODE_3190_length_3070_cov_1.758667_1_plen_41_part_10